MSKTISKAFQDKAIDSLAHYFSVAQESEYILDRKTKIQIPSIAFNQRGRVAGSALIKENIIRLNRRLYEHNEDYFLHQVIPHELAHLIVAQVFPKKVRPHGLEWQYIMVEIFKCPADVTHKLDTSVLGLPTFKYRCNCQVIELSSIRHNKVVQNKQSYRCRKCGETLILFT